MPDIPRGESFLGPFLFVGPFLFGVAIGLIIAAGVIFLMTGN